MDFYTSFFHFYNEIITSLSKSNSCNMWRRDQSEFSAPREECSECVMIRRNLAQQNQNGSRDFK